MPRGPTSTTKFRFKSRKTTITDDSTSRRRSRSPLSSSQFQRHDRDHRRRRPDDSRADSPHRPRPVSPESAFRESLFDALADDEGASYWEGVYGQPIHNYSRFRSSSRQTSSGEPLLDSEGKPVLEYMSDDEYANYVRARMWEKSHGNILEERKQRDTARQRQRDADRAQQATQRSAADRTAWNDMLHDSVGRRHEKVQQEMAMAAWRRYIEGWDCLQAMGKSARAEASQDTFARDVDRVSGAKLIPWPTPSGQSEDVHADVVERFFRQSLAAISKASPTIELQAALKTERVRWHPDKMMQQYGLLGIDASTLQRITAVFQILDSFWTALKNQVQ